MSEDHTNERAVKPEDGKKKPEPRRTGQRETIIAGKKYRLRVFLCKDPTTGKKRYHSETFHGTAAQAEDRIREIIRRYRAGEAIKASADTFGAMLDEWLDAKRLSVSEASHKTYSDVVETSIRPSFGQKLLARIDAGDVERLYVKLRDDGVSPAYVRYVHAVLAMVFKLAVRRKKLMGSPMAGVELPKADDAGADESKPAMSADQVAKFFDAAAGGRFENLFKLAFHVGFRPGELLALKWADFDQAARTLRVTHNIVWRSSGDWYLKKPKTKNSRRTLPLTPAIVTVLKAQRTAQLEARMKAGKSWKDHDFIFADAFGEPYPQWVLNKDCKRILKAAGLPATFTPYSARHTMATILLAQGVNPKAVSERMGHSRITTTLGNYAHVLPGMQEDVSVEIERLLNVQK